MVGDLSRLPKVVRCQTGFHRSTSYVQKMREKVCFSVVESRCGDAWRRFSEHGARLIVPVNGGITIYSKFGFYDLDDVNLTSLDRVYATFVRSVRLLYHPNWTLLNRLVGGLTGKTRFALVLLGLNWCRLFALITDSVSPCNHVLFR